MKEFSDLIQMKRGITVPQVLGELTHFWNLCFSIFGLTDKRSSFLRIMKKKKPVARTIPRTTNNIESTVSLMHGFFFHFSNVRMFLFNDGSTSSYLPGREVQISRDI